MFFAADSPTWQGGREPDRPTFLAFASVSPCQNSGESRGKTPLLLYKRSVRSSGWSSWAGILSIFSTIISYLLVARLCSVYVVSAWLSSVSSCFRSDHPFPDTSWCYLGWFPVERSQRGANQHEQCARCRWLLSLAAGSSSVHPGQEDPLPHRASRFYPSLSARGEIERLSLVLIVPIAQAAPGEDDQEHSPAYHSQREANLQNIDSGGY